MNSADPNAFFSDLYGDSWVTVRPGWHFHPEAQVEAHVTRREPNDRLCSRRGWGRGEVVECILPVGHDCPHIGHPLGYGTAIRSLRRTAS